MSAPIVFPPPSDPIDIDPGVTYQYVIPSSGETTLGFLSNSSFQLSLNGRVLSVRFTDNLPATTSVYTITVYASNADGITKQSVNFRINIPQAWIANPRFQCSPVIPGAYTLGATLTVPLTFHGSISPFLRNGDKITFGAGATGDALSGQTFYVRNIGRAVATGWFISGFQSGPNDFNISSTPNGPLYTFGPLFGGAFPVNGGTHNAAVIPIAAQSAGSSAPGTNSGGYLLRPQLNQGFTSTTVDFVFRNQQNTVYRIGIASSPVSGGNPWAGPFDVFDSGWVTHPANFTITATGLPTDGRLLYVSAFVGTTLNNGQIQGGTEVNDTFYAMVPVAAGSPLWLGSTADLSVNDPVAIAFSDGRVIPSDLAGTKYLAGIIDQNHGTLANSPGGATITPAEDLGVDPDGSDLLVLYRLKRRFIAITSDAETDVNPSDSIDYKPASDIAPDSWEAQDLPAGLTMSSQTGEITGAVSQVGYYAIAIGAVLRNTVSFRYWILKVGTPTVTPPPGGGGSPGITPSLLLPIADVIFDIGTRKIYDVNHTVGEMIEVVLGDTPLLIGFRRFGVDDVLPDGAQLRFGVKPRLGFAPDFDASFLIGGTVLVSGDASIANCHENWAAQSLFDLFNARGIDLPYIDLLGQISYRLKSDVADHWRNSKPLLIRLFNSVFATPLPDFSGAGGGGGLVPGLMDAGVISVKLPNNGTVTVETGPFRQVFPDNHYSFPAQLYYDSPASGSGGTGTHGRVSYKIERVKFSDHAVITIICSDIDKPDIGATDYINAFIDWSAFEYAPTDPSSYSPAPPASSPSGGGLGANNIIVLLGITLHLGVDTSGTLPQYGSTLSKAQIASNSGALPPGISLGADGSLSGTPSNVGIYPVLIQSLANGNVVATYSLTITVTTPSGGQSQSQAQSGAPPIPTYTGPSQFNFRVNVPLGSTPLAFANAVALDVIQGPLPSGITISGGTLNGNPVFFFTGTPTTADEFSVTIRAHGPNGAIADFVFDLLVAP